MPPPTPPVPEPLPAAAGELNAIVADLPASPSEGQSIAEQPVRAEIRAVVSSQERKLAGLMPRELTLRARLGYVELDLTEAFIGPRSEER